MGAKSKFIIIFAVIVFIFGCSMSIFLFFWAGNRQVDVLIDKFDDLAKNQLTMLNASFSTVLYQMESGLLSLEMIELEEAEANLA